MLRRLVPCTARLAVGRSLRGLSAVGARGAESGPRVQERELVDFSKRPNAEELSPLLQRLIAHRQQDAVWQMYTKLRSLESDGDRAAPLLSSEHYRLFLHAVSSSRSNLVQRALHVEQDLRQAGLYDERDAGQVAALIKARTNADDFDGASEIYDGAKSAAAAAEEPLAARVVSAFILACGRAGKPEEALSLYDEHIRPADARVPRPERSKALAYVMNGFARRGDLDSARALLDGFDGDVSSLHVNAMLQAYLTRAQTQNRTQNQTQKQTEKRTRMLAAQRHQQETETWEAEEMGDLDAAVEVDEIDGVKILASPTDKASRQADCEEALSIFEQHIGWAHVAERADPLTIGLLIKVCLECGDLSRALDVRAQAGEAQLPNLQRSDCSLMQALIDDGRVGSAFKLYERSVSAFGIPGLQMIHILTNACYHAANKAPYDTERALWMQRSLRLFSDGQSLVETRQKFATDLGVSATASQRPREGRLLGGRGDVSDDEEAPQTDLNRMNLSELRQFVRTELGSGISLQVGGASGRTRSDIVREALAALSARQPLPESSLAVNNPAAAASRLDLTAQRIEKAHEAAQRTRSPPRAAPAHRTARGKDQWHMHDDGRMFPSNRRRPSWAGGGGADEEARTRYGERDDEDDDSLAQAAAQRRNSGNTKDAWYAKRREKKAQAWAERGAPGPGT